MLANRHIIIFGDDWGRHPSTIQHIARVLSKHNKILWVSSLGLRRPQFRFYDLKRILGKIAKMISPSPGGESEETIIQMHPFVFPFYDIMFIRKINALLLRMKIRKMMDRHGSTDVILLISTPIVVDLVGTLCESSSHYLCLDDYGRFDGVFRSIPVMEREMLNKVDSCFAISDLLLKSRQCKTGENYYLPQGVDLEHFQRTPMTTPDQILNIKKPIVGFFGLISSWVDVRLVYECAKIYPSISFVLIGRTSIDLMEYQTLKNFYYLGEVPYEQLPEYAHLFDVGIVPFIVNELTLAANPLKILEYLAVGLPVICTNLPEAKKFGDTILIAHNKEEFMALIERAIEMNDPAGRKRRQLKAQQYSWGSICEMLSRNILHIENNKTAQSTRGAI